MENNNKINNPMISPLETEDTIDILELFRVLWKRVLVLIIALIIGATGAAVGTMLFITPQYESKSMIYIYGKTTSITSLTDLQLGSQLTVDFQIIAKTREVIEAAAYDIGLNESYESIVDRVTINNPQNSRILEIIVRDSDPTRACNLSNSIANQLRIRIADVMNTDEPSTVEAARVALHPVSPSIKKNAVLGGLGAFAVAAAIVIAIHLLDDTIKSEEDIEKYMHQNVIAVVPLVNGLGGGKHSAGKKKKKSSSSKKTEEVATT